MQQALILLNKECRKRGGTSVQVKGFSVYVMGEEQEKEKLERAMKGRVKFVAQREEMSMFWKNNLNFYEFRIEQKDIANYRKLCLAIERIMPAVKWEMFFYEKKDCFPVLLAKGFKKYEGLEYIEFLHHQKSARIAVFRVKDDCYCASVQKVSPNSSANSSYSTGVFDRIYEIVESGKERDW